TWTLQHIVEQCMQSYELSLGNTALLKNTPIEDWDGILIPGTLVERQMRPTLYDFLAHRAIAFYSNSESSLTKPAKTFVVDKVEYFAAAETFATLQLQSDDALSFDFKALQLWQAITQFHLERGNRLALADLETKRVAFVYNKTVLPQKDELYVQTLQRLSEQYADLEDGGGRALLALANYYNNTGEQFNPLQSDAHQWDKKTALTYCTTVLTRFPNTNLAIDTEILRSAILAKVCSFAVEQINLPNQPLLMSLRYRNVGKMYFRVVKVSRQDLKNEIFKDYYEQEKTIRRILSKPTVEEWSIDLPDDQDYQSHSAEAKIPALPVGEYMLVSSAKADFSTTGNNFYYGHFSVSGLSFIQRNTDEGSDFYLLDRNTGAPIANATAQIWISQYNYKSGNYENRKGAAYKTNEKGYFNYPKQRESEYFYVEFETKNETIYSIDPVDYYGNFSAVYNSDEVLLPSEETVFFADRAIYRPGQTLYFKGILMEHNYQTQKFTLKKNAKTTVTLYDVNYQAVKTVEFTTNEFGTFTGEFKLPNSGLNGQMYLSNGTGEVYFSVEDYKRPKFEVKFNPTGGLFRLDEALTMKGEAKAYSGANIDGATVKYRVVRKARFPYWWYCWYGYYPNSAETEILNGTTQTNEKGEFVVNFTALPDRTVPVASDPIFTYQVYADVTDINGETHSANGYIAVGYKALSVSIDLKDKPNWDKNEAQSFVINTANLSGSFEPAQGSLSIYKLQNPAKAYRSRAWSRPDKHLYTQDEWAALFPSDQYDDENNHFKWGKESQVYSQNFNTAVQKEISLAQIANWQPGMYMIEATAQDPTGQEVREVAYLMVYDTQANKLPFPTLQIVETLHKGALEPGQVARFLTGSSAAVNMLFEVEKNGNFIEQRWIPANEAQQILSVNIQEAHRGNLAAYFAYVWQNRLYNHTEIIEVSHSDKLLDISFETFRDKLQPGEEEEWRIKITGKDKEKASAELVAALYDASLDTFRPNAWNFNILSYSYANYGWSANNSFGNNSSLYNADFGWNPAPPLSVYRGYDALNYFGLYFHSYYNYDYYYADQESVTVSNSVARAGVNRRLREDAREMKSMDKDVATEDEKRLAPTVALKKEEAATKSDGIEANEQVVGGERQDLGEVQVRRNFNETAFFLPNLRTDEEGNITIKFKIPEALTRWKMLGFAHTEDLKFGLTSKELMTQKTLMVTPNAPRFLRESDQITLTTKVTNLAETDLSGVAQLLLFNALDNQPIDNLLGNTQVQQAFSVAKGQSIALSWDIQIPAGLDAVTYRVVAKAGNFSDGEESTLPVLSNSMLVTETMPMPIRGNQTKTFTLDKLYANASSTLRHQSLTLEFTSNPAWYAIQALPYLMEFPHECAEQVFSRLYANSIAAHVVNASPKIKQVFDSWQNESPEAFLSNLEKNEELKSLILQETPWVMQAQNEQSRKRNVGVLFDLNKMGNELSKAIDKLKRKQVANGAWTWFEGMPEDRYITQHIVTGIGHLKVLGISIALEDNRIQQMMQAAVGYLDRKIKDDYDELKRLEARKVLKMSDDNLGYFAIQYLYARSFFMDIKLPKSSQDAVDYFKGQAKKYWTNKNLYAKGMLALAIHRFGEDKNTPQDIVKSLREFALSSEEMGMYWKQDYGYYWYQAPIETQALMIEVFDEVAQDRKVVDDLRTWLLKQKQTQDWKTTKATAEACYALLLRGQDWLTSDKLVDIQIGNIALKPYAEDSQIKAEAGTGYFKTAWKGAEISNEMAKVTITKGDEGVSWGALYWQYFEQLDKITSAETPLKLQKQLFLEQNTDTGPVITPITDQTVVKVGDLIKVRVVLQVDREMEYVHMKDMRASGLEPTNVISQYKYQDGLGYYESTRDAATHFFFGYLPKGTFVFEYPLRVAQQGDFSNGITTIQCMYAPEFSSHSQGVRLKVGK
ncbi:MAG TPA: hypothetical protein DCM08_02015, partial [Microscillaceae bacterium]|nr:hypothetical protein [Microscillaceae bacterium]